MEELKNMLGELVGYILKQLYQPIAHISLEYENTKTKIRDNEYPAAFYFLDASDARFKSHMSEKVVGGTQPLCESGRTCHLIHHYGVIVVFHRFSSHFLNC